MRIALGSFLSMLCIDCAAAPLPADAWQSRLRGDTVLILGEVHDNAEQHRLRLEVLHRAFAQGWRPAIAMEQFDRDRQDGIEQARLERPGNAQRHRSCRDAGNGYPHRLELGLLSALR
jgi:hypothetical protein